VIKKTIEDNKGAIIEFIRDGVITLIEIIPDLLQGLDFINRAFLKFQQVTNATKKVINVFVGAIANIGKSAEETKAIVDAVQEDNKALTENTRIAEQNADARSKAILNIVDRSKQIVNTTVEQIKANSDETKSFVKNNQVKLGLIKELSEEQIKAQEALRKKEAERIEKLSTLNLNGLEGNFNINVVLPKDTEGQIALGLGGLNKALEGAKGATELIASGAGAIANTFLPGIGAAVQQLVSVLAQGPAAVQALISAFIQQIPVIIQNVILAIPAVIQAFVDNLPTFIQALVSAIPTIITGLIEAVPRLITSIIDNIPIIIQNLADQLPVVIERLVERVPEIITAIIVRIPEIIQAIITKIPTIAIQFGTSLAAQAPFIATQFAIGFVKEIPTIAKGIAEAIPKAVAGAAGDVGKGIGGVVGGIGKLFGFAGGGGVELPQGDTLLAGFNAGETVINERQTQRFNQLLDRIEARTDQPAVQQQSDNRPLIINLQVGEKQLADVILNLNRNGFRLA
jgi:phage-related protein